MQDRCHDDTHDIEFPDDRDQFRDRSQHLVDDRHQDASRQDVAEQTQGQRQQRRDLAQDVEYDKRRQRFEPGFQISLSSPFPEGIHLDQDAGQYCQDQCDRVVRCRRFQGKQTGDIGQEDVGRHRHDVWSQILRHPFVGLALDHVVDRFRKHDHHQYDPRRLAQRIIGFQLPVDVQQKQGHEYRNDDHGKDSRLKFQVLTFLSFC